ELKKLDDIRTEFMNRTRKKRERIRNLQEQAGPLDDKNMLLFQQIELEDLRCVKKELLQVYSDLRRLRVEISLHPDRVEEVWPYYAIGLNALPGPGLPINHALVALLHDDAHLLNTAANQRDRLQKQERLRFLEEMKTALLIEAERLDRQTRRTKRDAP